MLCCAGEYVWKDGSKGGEGRWLGWIGWIDEGRDRKGVWVMR